MISSEIWFMSDLSVVETLAKVKWFSPYKGFGFVSVEGIAEDIFLHFSVFEASRLPSLGNGDIILCQISHTEKGFQVTAIKEIVQANKYVVDEGNEKIVNAIPDTLSTAATSGIGLFIAFIGLKNMGLIIKNEATLVSIGKFSPATILSIIGLVIMIFFELKKIKGGILISIIITSIAGVLLGLVKMPTSVISAPPSIAPIFMKLDILGAFKLSLIGTIFSFMFIDLFNSLSFMMACYENMDSISVEKRREGLKRMLFVDVSSTLIGSILGTSTVTSFSESAAGISVGARTGLASVVTAFFFLLALLFTPIVEVIPSYATAPALVFVGVFIFKVTMNIDFSDLKLAIPSFLTIIMMPLTASIGDGLSFGFVSYIICFTICGKWKEISPVLWIVGILAFINLML